MKTFKVGDKVRVYARESLKENEDVVKTVTSTRIYTDGGWAINNDGTGTDGGNFRIEPVTKFKVGDKVKVYDNYGKVLYGETTIKTLCSWNTNNPIETNTGNVFQLSGISTDGYRIELAPAACRIDALKPGDKFTAYYGPGVKTVVSHDTSYILSADHLSLRRKDRGVTILHDADGRLGWLLPDFQVTPEKPIVESGVEILTLTPGTKFQFNSDPDSTYVKLSGNKMAELPSYEVRNILGNPKGTVLE